MDRRPETHRTQSNPSLSSRVRDQVARPSPIRQIMKMAERESIMAMGLDPADVISFGGGWVDHPAPEGFRRAYEDVAGDPELFHQSGAYGPTLGRLDCREAIARFSSHLFQVPRLGPEHVAVGMGSTQLTHDLIRTLVDPGDPILLLDPTYANYEGQLAWATPGSPIVRLPVLDPDGWRYLPDEDPEGVISEFHRLFSRHRPRLVLFSAPDNPTGRILPDAVARAILERTGEEEAWLAVDFAYKVQTFAPEPEYYRWSPADHPHFVAIHSNSKWARGLGRRLGWIEASTEVVDGLERTQQCSILCPDTFAQMTMVRYLEAALNDGSLKAYVEETRRAYREAASRTVEAIDEHLGRPRLEPAGGLYTVVDVGAHAGEFVPRALKATGVLVVPGGGFGPSLSRGVRISYGPMVRTPERIDEGLSRLGRWMRQGANT
jgi:aminotransferase